MFNRQTPLPRPRRRRPSPTEGQEAEKARAARAGASLSLPGVRGLSPVVAAKFGGEEMKSYSSAPRDPRAITAFTWDAYRNWWTKTDLPASSAENALLQRTLQVYKDKIIDRMLAEEILEKTRKEGYDYKGPKVSKRRLELAEAMALEEVARIRMWQNTVQGEGGRPL